nr:immunoglobulin heavy chain junction region [Macaca mulatta]
CARLWSSSWAFDFW